MMDELKKNETELEKKYRRKADFRLILGILCGLVLAFTGSVLYKGKITLTLPVAGKVVLTLPTYELFHNSSDSSIDTDEIENKIKTIEYFIDNEYYYDTPKSDIEDGIYKGMLSALNDEDPYATYYTVDEMADELTDSRGSFGGIGVHITEDEETGGIFVVKTEKNGPADKAGIKANDIIVMADDVSLIGMDLETAADDHIKGEIGTSVKLTVLRNGEELSFDVIRDTVEVTSVYYSTVEYDGEAYGYVYISQVLTSTINKFTEAIDFFEKVGVSGIVIDVRNNLGGDMNTALDMADYLVPDNDGRYTADTEVFGSNSGMTLLLSIDKKTDPTTYYYGVDGHSVDIPVSLIVNDYTASAAEILTGVLRSYGAKAAGTNTYGKGIVQNVRMLYDKSGIKYTSGEYVLPDGSRIHKVGIVPDMVIEATDEMYENGVSVEDPDPELDVQLKEAIKLLEGDR